MGGLEDRYVRAGADVWATGWDWAAVLQQDVDSLRQSQHCPDLDPLSLSILLNRARCKLYTLDAKASFHVRPSSVPARCAMRSMWERKSDCAVCARHPPCPQRWLRPTELRRQLQVPQIPGCNRPLQRLTGEGPFTSGRTWSRERKARALKSDAETRTRFFAFAPAEFRV